MAILKNNNKFSPELIFFKKKTKKIQTFKIDFECQILAQNTINSFEYADFWPFFLRFEKTYQLLKWNGFGLQFKWMPVQMNDCICITQTPDYLHISAQTQEYTALQHQVKIL